MQQTVEVRGQVEAQKSKVKELAVEEKMVVEVLRLQVEAEKAKVTEQAV